MLFAGPDKARQYIFRVVYGVQPVAAHHLTDVRAAYRSSFVARSGNIKSMFTEYINAAMETATFEVLSDGTVYGEIPGLRGVWSNADTEEESRAELEEVLEEWIALSLSKNLPIPEIAGVSLEAPRRGATA